MVNAEVIEQIILSAVLFLLVWQLVGNQIFKPFFELLEKRDARTVGDDKQVIAKRTEIKQLEASIEDVLRKARLEAVIKRDEKVLRAKKKAQEILAEAASRADEELRKSEQIIAELKAHARLDVGSQAEQLAGEVANKARYGKGVGLIH